MTFTNKQQRFVDEFLIDQNATAAYKRAGYRVKNDNVAGVCAARLLRNVNISAAVKAGLAKLAERTGISAEAAWNEVGFLAMGDVSAFLDITGPVPKMKPANEIPRSAWASCSSVKVKRYLEGGGADARAVEVIEYTIFPKLKALEMILKALKELKDQMELTGKDGGPIEHLVLLDVTTEEFKALPVEEKLRQLREAIVNSRQVVPKAIEK